jgi:hypothetical protein
MVYVLILVVLGAGNAGLNQPLRVAHFRSLESCQAAADEAKGIGLERGSFGFVCVRAFGNTQRTLLRKEAGQAGERDLVI